MSKLYEYVIFVNIMEASTLHKKKNTISKGKLKKNIKNVICRPDPVFWPEITEQEVSRLQVILNKHKVKIPEFKKAHWKEIKIIPKENRPKPPKIKKVEGLLFGISECSNAIQNKQCSAIVIESTVNPRMIVEPVVQTCTLREIPVLCMKDLRKLTLTNFGVKTSCLGLKAEYLPDVLSVITDISKSYPQPIAKSSIEKMDVEQEEKDNKTNMPVMDIVEKKEIKCNSTAMEVSESPYLYRTNKKTRVFVPTSQENIPKPPNKFIGQDFIEFSDKVEQNGKSYMKMILKRISNNPNRVKKK